MDSTISLIMFTVLLAVAIGYDIGSSSTTEEHRKKYGRIMVLTILLTLCAAWIIILN